MIDEACLIPSTARIDHGLVVHRKEEGMMAFDFVISIPLARFVMRDTLASVFDNPRAFAYGPGGKSPIPVQI